MFSYSCDSGPRQGARDPNSLSMVNFTGGSGRLGKIASVSNVVGQLPQQNHNPKRQTIPQNDLSWEASG